MTARQREVLAQVFREMIAGRWYRAQSSGERVTLASLHRHGALERRAWRQGAQGRDSAHEYTIPEAYRPADRRELAPGSPGAR